MGIKDYHMELQALASIHLHSNLDYEFSSNSSISRVYMFIAIGALILLIALINYMNLINCSFCNSCKGNWDKKSNWFISKQPCWLIYFRSTTCSFHCCFYWSFVSTGEPALLQPVIREESYYLAFWNIKHHCIYYFICIANRLSQRQLSCIISFPF